MHQHDKRQSTTTPPLSHDKATSMWKQIASVFAAYANPLPYINGEFSFRPVPFYIIMQLYSP